MKTQVWRHSVVVGASTGVAALFWFGRLDWDPEMRLWRSVGDTSLLLLYATLLVGPLVQIASNRATRGALALRRQTGIWFGVLALVHTTLVWDGWARWDIGRLFGYEFVPQLDRVARLEPGFGLANLMGLAAVLITIPLLVTSGDWAMRRLGAQPGNFFITGRTPSSGWWRFTRHISFSSTIRNRSIGPSLQTPIGFDTLFSH